MKFALYLTIIDSASKSFHFGFGKKFIKVKGFQIDYRDLVLSFEYPVIPEHFKPLRSIVKQMSF